MLEFVILIGVVSALIFTIISVGMTETTDTAGKNDSYVPLATCGGKANNWYNEYGFNFNLTNPPDGAYKTNITYDTSGINNTRDSLLNMVVEIFPPYVGGLGDDKVKYVRGEKGDKGDEEGKGDSGDNSGGGDDDGNTPVTPSYPPIDGDGGSGEDTFRKYFGNGTFIYAPNNSGVFNGITYGTVTNPGNVTDNNSTGAGDNYSQTRGNVLNDDKPANTKFTKPPDNLSTKSSD